MKMHTRVHTCTHTCTHRERQMHTDACTQEACDYTQRHLLRHIHKPIQSCRDTHNIDIHVDMDTHRHTHSNTVTYTQDNPPTDTVHPL